MAGPYDLAGTGIQAVAQPAALIVTATHLGTRVTQGTANPPNYRNIGQLTPGDADGWYGAVPIRVSPQKIVLPAGVTQLGYGLLAGSTVHVVEVPPPPVLNSSLNPWDRNPATVAVFNNIFCAGGTPDTVLWSYTVPAAKLLAVAELAVSISRTAAPTGVSWISCYVLVNGTVTANCLQSGGVVGTFTRDAVDAGPLWLPAGTTLVAHTQNTDVGGEVLAHAALNGTLFDV